LDGTFYEQTDGVAMVSLLAPIVANIYKYMEKFKQEALSTAKRKPTH
jgi:hypothetical protein